jgi:hypothetical protein
MTRKRNKVPPSVTVPLTLIRFISMGNFTWYPSLKHVIDKRREMKGKLWKHRKAQRSDDKTYKKSFNYATLSGILARAFIYDELLPLLERYIELLEWLREVLETFFLHLSLPEELVGNLLGKSDGLDLYVTEWETMLEAGPI